MTTTETSCAVKDDQQSLIERRAFVRHPCDLESACQPIASTRGMQWTGKVQNISRGGLSLHLGRRFELGTLLAIDVQGKDRNTHTRTLLARVVHVSLQETTTWVMGCKFASALTDDDVAALL